MDVPKQRKHASLDARHQAELDAIGLPRFESGDFITRVIRCYAVAGDEAIWLPETDVTYFVVECRSVRPAAPVPMTRSWVNRLRFNGHAQLKEFIIEAAGMAPARHDLITEAVCEEVVSDLNPLAGTILRLHVSPPKQPSGYMHHRWGRVSSEDADTWERLLNR